MQNAAMCLPQPGSEGVCFQAVTFCLLIGYPGQKTTRLIVHGMCCTKFGISVSSSRWGYNGGNICNFVLRWKNEFKKIKNSITTPKLAAHRFNFFFKWQKFSQPILPNLLLILYIYWNERPMACFTVLWEVTSSAFLCSNDGQGETSYYCSWRCGRENCNHCGKMLWICVDFFLLFQFSSLKCVTGKMCFFQLLKHTFSRITLIKSNLGKCQLFTC